MSTHHWYAQTRIDLETALVGLAKRDGTGAFSTSPLAVRIEHRLLDCEYAVRQLYAAELADALDVAEAAQAREAAVAVNIGAAS